MSITDFYKRKRRECYALASWCFLAGFFVLLTLHMLHVSHHGSCDSEFRLAVRGLFIAPMLVLMPREFFRWKGRPLIYKMGISLILFSFLGCFWGAEMPSVKATERVFKDVLAINAVLVGGIFALDLACKLKHGKKWLFLGVCVLSCCFLNPIYHYFVSFNPLMRLGGYFQDGEILAEYFAHPNLLGVAGVMLLAIVLSLMPEKKGRLSAFLMGGGAMTILLTVALLTRSRSAVVAVILLLGVCVVFFRGRRLVVFLVSFAVALGAYSFVAYKGGEKVEAKYTASALVERKSSGRTFFWEHLYQRLEGKEKITGKGYFASTLVELPDGAHFASHSTYVGIYYRLGVIGLALLCILMLSVLIQSIHLARMGYLLPISLVAVTVVTNMVEGVGVLYFRTPGDLRIWLPIIAVIAFSERVRSLQKEPNVSTLSGDCQGSSGRSS